VSCRHEIHFSSCYYHVFSSFRFCLAIKQVCGASAPLIITLIALPILPDQVPAHFGFDGNVTRYGSKYEQLITPAFALFMLPSFALTEKYAKKHEPEKVGRNAKTMFWTSIFCSALFTALTSWFLHLCFADAQNLTGGNPEVAKIVGVVMGVGFIIIGNILPKVKRNTLLGIRLPWTLASEINWYKTHRFGGRLFFIGGIVMTSGCLLVLNGVAGLIFCGAVLGVVHVPIVVYSYSVYKAEGEARKQGHRESAQTSPARHQDRRGSFELFSGVVRVIISPIELNKECLLPCPIR